jgi:hypothetical protein
MVSQVFKLSELQQLLVDGLRQLPQEWALTPVYGDKRPYRQDWQKERPLAKELLERDIRNGKPGGMDYAPGRYRAE